ncbi:MAG: transporter permease [Oscillospiraceae bacterium]|nr:transporter permease [Oscillospiraceae bacterium]
MKFFDIIGMCFKNLWRRKLRTLLTVLGVVIGSCAIIVMISLGLGSNAALEYSLKQMGDLNVVTVYGNNNGGGVVVDASGSSKNASGAPPKLDDAALETIKALDGVEVVFPKLRLDSNMFSIYAGKNNRYKAQWIEIYGVFPEELEKFGYKIDQGQLPAEMGNKYIIFGSQAAYQFADTKRKNRMVWKEDKGDGTFTEPFFKPLEETIFLAVNNTKKDPDSNGNYQSGGRSYEHKLKVAAVLKEDYNKYESVNAIMLDMGFAKQLLADYNRLNGIKNYDTSYTEVAIWVKDLNKVGSVQDAVTEMGFQAYSMDSIRDQLQGQVVKQQMLLGGLAAISLFVAAIGITNTMIMSIYERTKEIGVMKVLGCFISNIRQMFLIEAGFIGFIGGVIGSIISIIISIVLNAVGGGAIGVDMYFGDTGKSVPISIIPFWLILLAIAFSTLIGLVSGFSPANRAVKISALEAIKNE